KDTTLHPQRMALNGLFDHRWPNPPDEMPWNFATIGRGHDREWWGRFVALLRDRGFSGTISIGYEDPFVAVEESVLESAQLLAAPVYCMEMTLWDIIGKVAGLPVARLWGGFSDRVVAYCATAEVRSPAQRVDDVQRMLSEGYKAVKFRFHLTNPRDDLKVVEAVRAVVGDRIEIMVDANQAGVEPGHGGHHSWGFPTALAVARELELMQVRWLEEPLPRHDYDGLHRLRDKLDTLAIAGGEDNHGLHEFKLLIDRGCYDILQPDALLSEGV